MRLTALLAMLGLALAAPATAKGDVTPLFVSDDPVSITISGPIRAITVNGDRSTEQRPATLAVNGETLPIMLSARGLSRRQKAACPFPPLLVTFAEKAPATSLFAKQGKIKLVTHCRPVNGFDQYALREYEVYRLYNILTPESLKVRLARIRYMDKDDLVAERWGFFIEDVDDLAKRLGGKELEVPTVPNSALNAADAGRYTLFQYMIGNLDWDMALGPKGTDCCHNSKLIGTTAEARTALIPVPYDFDFSGIVDTPYAGVPDQIPINSVRTRYYRGLCIHTESVRRAIPEFIAARSAMEADIRKLAPLSDRVRGTMLNYLAGFFEDIGNPAQLDRKLFAICR